MRLTSTVPAALCLFLCFSTAAHAAEGFLEANPATWRLQNYVGDGKGLAIWYSGSTDLTGASCHGAGKLFLPVTAPLSEHERLWSLIMAAKLSGRKVFIFFERPSTANQPTCGQISSFGIEAP